jgi:hypothetical protein
VAQLNKYPRAPGITVALLTVGTNRGADTGVMNAEMERGDVTQKIKAVAPISMVNKALYCARHKYDFVVGKDNATVGTDLSRSSKWNKVAWVKYLMTKYDYVIWMDLDTVFTFDVDMMEFVDPAVDIHFTKDMHERGLNSGVFIVKSTNWSKAFFDSVWLDNDQGLGLDDQVPITRMLAEQVRLDPTVETTRTKFLPKPIFNAFPNSDQIFRKGVDCQWWNSWVMTSHAGDQHGDSLVIHAPGRFAGQSSVINNPSLLQVGYIHYTLEIIYAIATLVYCCRYYMCTV